MELNITEWKNIYSQTQHTPFSTLQYNPPLGTYEAGSAKVTERINFKIPLDIMFFHLKQNETTIIAMWVEPAEQLTLTECWPSTIKRVGLAFTTSFTWISTWNCLSSITLSITKHFSYKRLNIQNSGPTKVYFEDRSCLSTDLISRTFLFHIYICI